MLDRMEVLFADWKVNGYDFGVDGWIDEQFDRALLDLDPRASVGLCAMDRWGATIGEALGWDPFHARFCESRVGMLRAFVKMRIQQVDNPDPILVFIKPEPHKRTKIDEGRYRLISAVSLIDTMVDRCMFGWLQRSVLANVSRTPVLVGWSPYQGGYRLITSRFPGLALCSDKSSWDWTMPGWLLLALKDLLVRLPVGAPAWWLTWVEERWKALFRDAVFGFRSGERIRQPGWGIMKSGCYLTLVLNSLSQCIIHDLACARLGLEPFWTEFFCVGDDVIQRPLPDVQAYLRVLSDLGSKVKEWIISREKEFCGHRMCGTYLVPAYTPKHVFKVITAPTKDLAQLLASYQWAYAMDEGMWNWLTRELVRLAPGLALNRPQALAMLQDLV